MAEKDTQSSELESGHEDMQEIYCSPCGRESKSSEARFYCKECDQPLCSTCCQLHDKLLVGHTLLGTDCRSLWSNIKELKALVMCDRHPDKEQDMYCQDHDSVYCSVCMNINHRACKSVQHVPDAAKGVNIESEFASLLTTATHTKTKLSNMFEKRKNNIELLQPSRLEIKTSLKNMRKNINQLLNLLEHKVEDEMERLLSILEKQLQSDIQSSRDIDLRIKNLFDSKAKLEKHSETLAFQITKKCKQELQLAETLLQVNIAETYKLELTADPRLEELLDSMETPGHLTISPVLQVSSAYTYTVTDYNVYRYSIKKDVGQHKKSLITGICQLAEGQTVMVDQGTEEVKLLSSSFSVVAIKKNVYGYIPQDVCHIKGQEIAVSLALPIHQYSRKNPKMQVTCMDGQLNELETFSLYYVGKSIAYKDGFFYIASQNAVQKHHKNGQIMKFYQDQPQRSAPDSSYNVALGTPNKISLCSTSKKLFITNMDSNCLTTMDNDGQILTQLNDPDLQELTAVCAADNGTVFVYSKKYNTVFQVDPNLRKITILATDKEGPLEPRCMCFDDKSQRLLVGQADKILVLKLKIK